MPFFCERRMVNVLAPCFQSRPHKCQCLADCVFQTGRVVRNMFQTANHHEYSRVRVPLLQAVHSAIKISFSELTGQILPDLRLLSGEFVVPVWLLDNNGVHRYHEVAASQNLIVKNRTKELGLYHTDREWEIEVLEEASERDGEPSEA